MSYLFDNIGNHFTGRAKAALDEINKNIHIQKFTPLQEMVFTGEKKDEFWNTNNDLMIRGATSSGKTLIAEIAMLKSIENHKSAIYLSPLRALVTEKFKRFQEDMKSLTTDRNNRVVASDKDYQNDDYYITEGYFSAAVVVYEKFYALLSQGQPDKILGNVDTVIMDEFQMIAHEERGMKILMTLINIKNYKQDIRIIFLTTYFSNMNMTLEYLRNSVGMQIAEIDNDQNSMSLEEIVLDRSGRYRGKYTPSIADIQSGDIALQKKKDDEAENLGTYAAAEDQYPKIVFPDSMTECENTREVKKMMLLQIIRNPFFNTNNAPNGGGAVKIIVFINSRSACVSVAKWLADQVRGERNQNPLTDEQRELRDKLEMLLEDDMKEDFLKKLMPCGIAYHHGGLTQALRDTIEEQFREGCFNVLIATETLAFGVNLPADVIVVYDTERHEYNTSGIRMRRALDTQTYKNYIGRAGRYGVTNADIIPRSYLLAVEKEEMDQYWNTYVNARETEIEPAFKKMRCDTALPYFLSMLGAASHEVSQLDRAFQRTMPMGDRREYFRILLQPTASEENEDLFPTSILDGNDFRTIWRNSMLLTDIRRRNRTTYTLTNYGRLVISYTFSLETYGIIYEMFLSSESDKNLLLQMNFSPENVTTGFYLELLARICQTSEVEHFRLIQIPECNRNTTTQYFAGLNAVQECYNGMIETDEIDEGYFVFDDKSPGYELTAAIRAYILLLWMRGESVAAIRRAVNLQDSFTEGDIERLAEVVAFVLEAAANALTVSENETHRGYASWFRRLSNRIKYGGDDELARVLSCHVYGLSRNALIKLQKLLREHNCADGNIYTYFSSGTMDSQKLYSRCKISDSQHKEVKEALEQRYDKRDLKKLLYNLRTDGLLDNMLDACLDKNQLSVNNTERFLKAAAEYAAMPFLLKEYREDQLYFRMSSAYASIYCVIVENIKSPSDFIGLYNDQFTENPGNYVIVVGGGNKEEMEQRKDSLEKTLDSYRESRFLVYTPDELLRIYLNTLPNSGTAGTNLFLRQLRQNFRSKEVVPAEHPDDEGPVDIFLSYSHRENAELAPDLFERFREKGKSVFLDVAVIKEGNDFTEKICGGIAEASTYVLVIGKEYLKSNWPRFEMNLIQKQYVDNKNTDNPKKILLILLDDSVSSELDKRGFGNIEHFKFEGDNRENLIRRVIERAEN